MSDIRQAYAAGNHLGEGPIWSVKEQVLYWVDIDSGTIFRLDPQTGACTSHSLGYSIGCLGLRKQGGLVLGSKRGFAFWDAAHGVTPVANPIGDLPLRFNDGKVDRAGRFFAGTMRDGRGLTIKGDLYRLNPDGSLHVMLSDIGVSNGIGWSPDNKTMYFTDTPTHRIDAFDYDIATGEMANRRTFATVAESDGNPDGMTVDSEGFVWSCHWNGWRITRYDPQGKVERVVMLPVERPTSVAFGGKNLDQLFVTSAHQGISDDERKKQPWLGDLLVLTPGVKGLPEPEFAG